MSHSKVAFRGLVGLPFLWVALRVLSSGQDFSSDRYDIEQKLKAGDMAVLDSMTNKAGLEMLYSLITTAQTLQFGDKSGEIEREIARRVATIDGHAQFVGDRIESLSEKLGTQGRREAYFLQLASAGTPEAIAQIGRFIDDQRWPEAKQEPVDPHTVGSRNNYYAAQALVRTLGNKSPVPRKMFYDLGDVDRLREWWHSPAAKEYRNLLTAPTEDASKLKAPEAAPPVAKVVTPLEAPKSQMGWWVLVGAVILGLAVWLLARTRKR